MEYANVSEFLKVVEYVQLCSLSYLRLFNLLVKPNMIQQHLRIIPVILVLNKGLGNEVFGISRDHIPNLIVKNQLTVGDRVEYLCLALALEGWSS